MKKLLALILALLLGTLLVSCNISDILGGGTTTPPPDNVEEDPKPLMRGDSAVIFGKNTAFTLVYPSGDKSAAELSDSMAKTVADLGFMKPEISPDSAKKDTQCELLIGETSRALSEEAKAALADAIAADPNGDHWVWMYKDGRVALYANGADAYALALAELEENYYVAGEIIMKKDTCDIGYVEGPHEAYMEYEIPDNFFEGYEDPFSVKEKDYKEMTITRIDAKTIRISYRDDSRGTFSADFVEKRWGVWNMGSIKYTEAKGVLHNITSSSTDYEFVLRVNGKGSTGLKSGNHGDYPKDSNWEVCKDPETGLEDPTSYYNDKMLDLTFYDGKSGEKLELPALGQSIVADGVRIVMHHNVYEFGYKQENVLINAERSYLFSGYDIMCDTKLYMTQDVSFGGSYSAMLPISKQYGNCCMFYLEDGSTTYMKTPLSNTVNDSVYGANATYVDLWGETNPKYHMIVKVNNPEDQYKSPATGTNKGYAGFREMLGGGSNKLYIQFGGTSFNMDWGDELHFNTSWSLSIQNDFKNPDREPDFWVGVPK